MLLGTEGRTITASQSWPQTGAVVRVGPDGACDRRRSNAGGPGCLARGQFNLRATARCHQLHHQAAQARARRAGTARYHQGADAGRRARRMLAIAPCQWSWRRAKSATFGCARRGMRRKRCSGRYRIMRSGLGCVGRKRRIGLRHKRH